MGVVRCERVPGSGRDMEKIIEMKDFGESEELREGRRACNSDGQGGRLSLTMRMQVSSGDTAWRCLESGCWS